MAGIEIRIRCSNCLILNRVEDSKLNSGPLCGSCKTVLAVPREPSYARHDSFDREIAYWPETMLVMFRSSSCVYCRIADPLIADLAARRAGRLKVLKVDVDDDRVLPEQFKITKTPTFLVYKAGEFVIRLDGPLKEKEELIRWIENMINYTATDGSEA